MIVSICKQCNVEIFYYKSQIFCSRKCRGEWESEQTQIDYDWLCDKYLDEELGVYQIAKLSNTSPSTVHRHLRKFGIPIREFGIKLASSDTCPKCGGYKYKYSEVCNNCKSVGERNPMYGRSHSPETIQKISEKATGRQNPKMRGANHPNWMGEYAEERSARQRAQRMYPLKPCEVCGSEKSERHHFDENPYNNEPENIRFLCRKHHKHVHHKIMTIT